MQATAPTNSPRPGGRWLRRAARALALVLLGTLPGLAPPGFAQPRSATETELKAAFILNFARYSAWPARAYTNRSAPMVFGVLARSDDPVAAALDRLAQGQTANQRPIRVMRLASLSEATNCHLLFLSASARPQMREVWAAVRKQPILTVSDVHPFATRGGMLGLVARGDRLHFEANPDAARNAGLRFSSHLLKLATVVKTAPP
jgi:hypothetical protein